MYSPTLVSDKEGGGTCRAWGEPADCVMYMRGPWQMRFMSAFSIDDEACRKRESCSEFVNGERGDSHG